MDEHDDIEVLAMAIHGALAFGHFVGILYNFRKKNYKVALFHGIAFLCDIYAVYMHWKDVKERK